MPKPPENDEQWKKNVEPYLSNGVEILGRSGDEIGCTCPFCDRPKFSINYLTGKAQCWSCWSGNQYTFVEVLYEDSSKGIPDYSKLSEAKGISPTTLSQWGVVWHRLLRCWAMPGYSPEGKIRQLYRYQFSKKKFRWWATTGLGHRLFGVHLWDKSKPIAVICEGAWDGMSLWEVMRGCRSQAGNLSVTTSDDNLLKEINVIAIPGCKSFRPEWARMFHGKVVHLFFDNDWPRLVPGGKEVAGAAREGLERAARLLSGSATPPQEIHYLKWGPNHYTDKFKSGFDVSDALWEF